MAVDFSLHLSVDVDGGPVYENRTDVDLDVRFVSRTHPDEIHTFHVRAGEVVHPDWDWRNDVDDYYWSAYDRDNHFHNGGYFRPDDHCFDHGCDQVVNQTVIQVYVLVENQYVLAPAVRCDDGRWFVANTVYVTAPPPATYYQGAPVIVPQGPAPYQYDRVGGQPTAQTPAIFRGYGHLGVNPDGSPTSLLADPRVRYGVTAAAILAVLGLGALVLRSRARRT